MYQLVIAEKPSVAMSIAKALGSTARKEGCMEGGGWLVSWCVGHLAELAEPAAYDPRYGKWRREDLPILPESWCFTIGKDKRGQFDTLRTLLRREDVSEVVNACDAGREGELIFRTAYHLAGCTKPIKRLWISSMEDSAIREGFANLRPGKDYDGLHQAALCRQKADWLVGINATRLFSVLYNRTLNIGRVMSPTLALIVQREAEIAAFTPEPFYTVELDCGGVTAAGERISVKKDASALAAVCEGSAAVIRTAERRERSEKSPALYDLTTLQREANRALGYTAQQTLDYLQALYEKKLCTYPRTDSRYLTEDMAEGLPALCSTVAGALSFMAGQPLPVHAAQVVDSSKVTDHHAVIPTAEIAGADLAALPTGERNILYMIAVRLLCAVGEAHTYVESAVTLDCGGASFMTKGRTVTAAGWKGTEKTFFSTLKQKNEKPAPELPALSEGQRLEGADALLKQGTTSPPARFTEDSLLLAMEKASADDFAKLEDVERTGLGTPATRAATIEKLVKSGFVERKKKQLLPTEKGLALSWAMPDQLKAAKLTAEWEDRLGAVERGELAPEDFMAGITAMLTGLVRSYRNVAVAPSPLSESGRAGIGKCPRCGKNVVEGKKSFYCEGYHDTPSCGFALWKNDRFFTSKRKELTKKIAASLLKTGRAAVTGLFSEKKGVFYDATVVLDDDGGKFVRFKLEFDNKSTEKKGK